MLYRNYQLIILLSALLFIVSCDGEDPIDDPTQDYSSVLSDIAQNVILGTYTDLDVASNSLLSSVNQLQSSPTTENLTAAKEAWIAAREPWEKSEGFLFGPVDTEGIDPAIDSWPVNQVDLENVLASQDELNSNFVSALEGTLKGYHTIEFLLWGEDGQKEASSISSREFEYLAASTIVFAENAGQLVDSWSPQGENFIENIFSAGTSASIYISQKSALEELANGILGIADEVGNGKINDPLEQEDPTLEESRFSNNSTMDFSNNIKSIQNIYNGISGSGLSNIVQLSNTSLDTQLKSEIQAAITAIESIPGTFTEAIPLGSPSRVDAENAQQAVRQLQSTIESELIPLISGL